MRKTLPILLAAAALLYVPVAGAQEASRATSSSDSSPAPGGSTPAQAAPTPIPSALDEGNSIFGEKMNEAAAESIFPSTHLTTDDAASGPALTPLEPTPSDAALENADQPVDEPESDSTALPEAVDTTETTTKQQSGKVTEAERLRQAIRIREMKTEMLTDPDLAFQSKQSKEAKTPEGHRVALRNFYTALYTKMKAKEPSLSEPLQAELTQHLAILAQRSIRPTPLVEAIRP
jgi:hypothetical protein